MLGVAEFGHSQRVHTDSGYDHCNHCESCSGFGATWRFPTGREQAGAVALPLCFTGAGYAGQLRCTVAESSLADLRVSGRVFVLACDYVVSLRGRRKEQQWRDSARRLQSNGDRNFRFRISRLETRSAAYFDRALAAGEKTPRRGHPHPGAREGAVREAVTKYLRSYRTECYIDPYGVIADRYRHHPNHARLINDATRSGVLSCRK